MWGPSLDPNLPILEPQELRSGKKVMQISISETMSALINEDGHLFTWGLSNEFGELGIHEDNPQNLPVMVTALSERVAT